MTYGTRYGSTRDIAECIRHRLMDAGFDTDLLQANREIDVTKYDALVVGSPLYAGQWLADPALLLIVNKERLTTTPVALFSVGMIDIKHPGKLREEHDAWIEKAFIQESMSLNIIASTSFNGAYFRRNFPLWMRIVDSILRITSQGDYRQWDEIENWADETAKCLKQILMDTEIHQTETFPC